eukprot:CAMPEP_0184675880 /NCGR_PEP_ID=MMETSP0308-20130426/88050_1 /TAXON_ID=38269 /ORGANISM="Gloeochaete witrockiana, Strain SAG 46.84" /LENGTH=43 /DNA_ID= /DNA_START= /DNA_END= /DNA_ORIENTATION=
MGGGDFLYGNLVDEVGVEDGTEGVDDGGGWGGIEGIVHCDFEG